MPEPAVDPDATVEELRAETERWRTKLADRLEHVEATDGEGEELLENARAYRTDADHFADEDDLVRAFEAVVWGWSWVEIGERLGHVREAGDADQDT